MSWQPIETAPKDGTMILAYDDFQKMVVMYWRPELEHWDNCFDMEDCQPTHWMALPYPPAY